MRASWIIATVAATACEESEPESVWMETEHLRVLGHEDTRVCAGTPLLLEREVARLLDELRLPDFEAKIDVVLGPEAPSTCPSGSAAAGCAGRNEDGRVAVLSSYEALPHELVHAVRSAAGVFGPVFYEEGLAQAFASGAITTQEIPAITSDAGEFDALQLERPETLSAYAVAASFVSWLENETDPQAFGDAFNGVAFDDISTREDLESWFSTAFGRTLAAARAEWTAAAPAAHVRPGPCAKNEPIVLVDDRFEMAGRIDCDDPATVGPTSPAGNGEAGIRSETRCLDLDGVNDVMVTLDAPLRVHLEARLRHCDTHAISALEFVIAGKPIELVVEPEHCWLDLRVFAYEDVATDYRWTLNVR